MGLMFDDSNEVRCPKCGGAYFHERRESLLDKQEDKFDTTYLETKAYYVIRCADCNAIIAKNNVPKIRTI